jgi:hypothetical protein
MATLDASGGQREGDSSGQAPLSVNSAQFWSRSRSPISPVMSPFGRPAGPGTAKLKDRPDGGRRSPSPLHYNSGSRQNGATSGRLKPVAMRSFGSCYDSGDPAAGLIRKSSQPLSGKVQADMRAPRQESAPGVTTDARRQAGHSDAAPSPPANAPSRRLHVLRLVGLHRGRRLSSDPR